MTDQPKKGGRESTAISSRAQQSAGDALQKAKGLGSHSSVDHQRRGNVQNAAKQAAPENGEQSIRVLRGQCSGRRVHEFLYGRVYKRISRPQEKIWLVAGHFAAGEIRLRVNRLTHGSEKRLTTARRFVAVGGVVLGLRCKTQHVPRKSWRRSRPLVSVSASIVSFKERRISRRGLYRASSSETLRHKGKTNP